MTQPSYESLLTSLRRARIPVREIGTKGKVAVTQAAGRVIAAAFAQQDEVLFWCNPALAEKEVAAVHPKELIGGLGGDRLWFSPELDFNWDGVPNWHTLENYKVPVQIDPGVYRFLDDGSDGVSLWNAGEVPVHGLDQRIGFEVLRSIRLVAPPVRQEDLDRSAIDYVGIETSHHVKLSGDTRTGRLGLWHLLQVPVGSILVVPIKSSGEPRVALESYALTGNWQQHADHVSWRFEGLANAKFGLPATALTGRSAVFRQLDLNRWCMIVRDFPVDSGGLYIDHPHAVPRNDQAFQAWDGLGFGEMEFHSPGLDATQGPRVYEGSDRLWAFGGEAEAIASLATRLLGVEVQVILRLYS